MAKKKSSAGSGVKIRVGTSRRAGASFKLKKAKNWGKAREFRLAHLLFNDGDEDHEIVPVAQSIEWYADVIGKELYVEFEGEITIADKAMAKALKEAENGSDYVLELVVDGKELESGVDHELKENQNLWIA
jgi:hypothetical protein